MKILKASFKGKSISDISVEYPEGLVTAKEIYRIVVEDTKLYVVWTDRDTGKLEAEWKVFDGVYTVAHIDDAVFEDGTLLSGGEEYGKIWLAYCNHSVEEDYQKYAAEFRKRKEEGK